MGKLFWTNDKLEVIKAYLERGMTIMQIAQKMNLTYKQIEHTVHKHGLRSQSEFVRIKEEKSVKPIKPVEISKLIIQSLKDELKEVEPYISSKPDKIDRKGDTLVIHLTDLHAGKIVKDQDGNIVYNESIFRKRINRLCEQTLKLLDNHISKGVPIKDVVLLLTGDLANGEGIYLTQAYEQEIAPPRQVMLVVDVMTKLITALLKRNLAVKVYGIRGNHGRTGKDTDVASNWDIMIYEILDFWASLVLKNPNLTIKFAETEHMVIDIRGHGYLIRHIAPEQVDSPAGRVKINEWARRHEVESIVYGHYHHAGIFDCDGIRVFRGGSTVGVDSLSENMAKSSAPLQLCWGVNEQRVSTFIYLVDIGDENN